MFEPTPPGILIDLIIFDNDGVLVDSEPIACDVLARLLTEFGLPTSYEDVLDRYLGGSIGRTRLLAEERLGVALPASFEDLFHGRLFGRLDKELQPVAGIVDALEQLDTSKCVASSGTPERVRLSLAITGLTRHFGEQIFSASQVPRGKPSPDLFLFAAERMGVRPESCVVVEDSPLGIEAANAAGMLSLGFAGLTPRGRLDGANSGVIRTMRELPEALARLGVRQVDSAGLSVKRGV